MIPLTMAEQGHEYIIQKIAGKEESKTYRHLTELGFVVGTPIKPVADLAGNLIVQVRESRVAIDKKLSSKIFV